MNDLRIKQNPSVIYFILFFKIQFFADRTSKIICAWALHSNIYPFLGRLSGSLGIQSNLLQQEKNY